MKTTKQNKKTVAARRAELFEKKVKIEREKEEAAKHVNEALDELLKPTHCEVTMYGITRSFDIAKEGWVSTAMKWAKSQIRDKSYELDPVETVTQRFRNEYKKASVTHVGKIQVGKAFVHVRFVTRG